MRDFLKFLLLFLLGFFTAIILYPFLHEAGHCAVAIILKAEVIEFKVFPLPHIICSTAEISNGHIAAIGMGGILVPYLISVLLSPKSFILWYTNVLLRVMSLLAVVISFANVVLYMCGATEKSNDISQVLGVLKTGETAFLLMFILMALVGILLTVKERPINKICRFFNLA